jgi:catechol 2,3-dioxygenase-like lactoylglutathione lyase family enzyme
MNQSLLNVSLVVREYDEAIAYFTRKLGFVLSEDTCIPEQEKRWVVVTPPGSSGAGIVLARAATPDQEDRIGNQTGGRVSFFLGTDDVWRDYTRMKSAGVLFVREPSERDYGTVAVFQDLYGNRWDLLQENRGEAR